MITRRDVVDQARSWIGTPFRWQGRDRLGIDCVGLAAVVARELGLVAQVPRPTYQRPLPAGAMLAGLRQHFLERAAPPRGCGGRDASCCADCRAELAGTVVYLGRAGMQHCGIHTGEQLISVSEHSGCVAVDMTGRHLRAITRVFDFPGVA